MSTAVRASFSFYTLHRVIYNYMVFILFYRVNYIYNSDIKLYFLRSTKQLAIFCNISIKTHLNVCCVGILTCSLQTLSQFVK